ncbi:MAG: MerR family transcriptional regulator [Propionibacteriaceae bacterium]
MTNEPLLTISAFGQLVGLSSSALRFYDECALLEPAAVDGRTGYRFYSEAQQREALLVRRMRDIEMPLPQVRAVLAAPAAEGAATLRAHLAETEQRADRARGVVEELVRALQDRDAATPDEAAVATVDGLEFAGALRQVAPAAATEGEIPGVQGVLVEIVDDELVVVATDRYWLAMRTVGALEGTTGARRALVDTGDLTELTLWLRRQPRVRVQIEADTLTCRSGDEVHTLATRSDAFPSYRSVLQWQEPWQARVVVDRTRLLDFVLAAEADATLRLVAGPDRLDAYRGESPLPLRLPAVLIGEPMTVAFSPHLLAAALDAAVGPDVLLELSAPERPCVIRSADQGTYTSVVMPRRPSDDG